MTSRDRPEMDEREYPQTWLLLDAVGQDGPRVGQEVVDLSPGAIELREVSREMRGYAEERDRWMEIDRASRWPRLGSGHRHRLSFGPVLGYCVEHDTSGRIHEGEPLRHLTVEFSTKVLTPATSAEIGLYFYGRRPAVFGYVSEERAHGFIGYDWDPVSREDVRWLLRREARGQG